MGRGKKGPPSWQQDRVSLGSTGAMSPASGASGSGCSSKSFLSLDPSKTTTIIYGTCGGGGSNC